MFWKFWRKAPAKVQRVRDGVFAAPDAGREIAVVADVHGMGRAFEAMLDLLAIEAPRAQIILVGDLIDRGEETAQVLRRAYGAGFEVLRGNHEEMLLKFMDKPEESGSWLRYGGLQTLASFGVGGVRDSSSAAELRAARDALRTAMGAELEGWLRGLPRMWRGGNVAVTHAGADPWCPIDAQPRQALTWGHPEFGKRARRDGLWVVHGHEIVPAPILAGGIISLDTGAYAGGGLTAVVLSGGTARFLSVPS